MDVGPVKCVRQRAKVLAVINVVIFSFFFSLSGVFTFLPEGSS